jgi:hypothetical protein
MRVQCRIRAQPRCPVGVWLKQTKDQDQDTRLRMPNKWHIYKESQADNNKKDDAAACLCFLNYLAFLRPAADRVVFILPWVVSPGRLYRFLWAGSIIQNKNKEGQSNSGLFASKRSKTPHSACWSPLGAKSASTDAPNERTRLTGEPNNRNM